MYIYCIGLKELFKGIIFKKKNNLCRFIFILCYVCFFIFVNGFVLFEFVKVFLEIEI